MELKSWFDSIGGVAGTIQMAAYTGASPARVRAWAADNGVPIVGSNAYAFTLDHAEQFLADVFGEEEDDEDYDEDDEDDEEEDDADEEDDE